MKTGKTFAAVVFLLIGTVVPVIAHHSMQAEYDSGKTVDVTGTVTLIRWVNPHVWVEIDVKEPAGADPTHWKLEMSPIACMEKHGISRETLTVGSTVTVLGSWRARDGSFHIPVFTMIYGNKSYRVQRSPSDPPEIKDMAQLNWCAP